MSSDKVRVWELRWLKRAGAPYTTVQVDGPIVNSEKCIKVREVSPKFDRQVKKLIVIGMAIDNFLDKKLGMIPADSRVRELSEDNWSTAMYLRDELQLILKPFADGLGE